MDWILIPIIVGNSVIIVVCLAWLRSIERRIDKLIFHNQLREKRR